MTYAKLIGTGSALPSKLVTNADLEKTLDTSHDWVVERTGIHQRYILADGEDQLQLGIQSARQAIEAANIDPNEIDLILYATSTPAKAFPSTACLLHQALDLRPMPAFDLNAACSGFLYAMVVADKMIKSQTAKTVLLVGGDSMSRIVDWTDRGTCILFADGAGAMLLQASDTPGILATNWGADGKFADLLYTEGNLTNGETPAYIQMKGREVMKAAVRKLGSLVEETVKTAGLKKEDIDWLVPHQANIRIIQAMAKQLGMSMDQAIITLDQHGNTSAASVPIAFDHALREGKIKPGQHVLLEAFGGGFTWGSALMKV